MFIKSFETIDGKTVRLSGLEKTSEFGGKGSGFSTRDEDAQVLVVLIKCL